jgi:hypothetical protein
MSKNTSFPKRKIAKLIYEDPAFNGKKVLTIENLPLSVNQNTKILQKLNE